MSDMDKTPGTLDEEKKGSEDKAWWQPALVLFFRFSAWIAAPVIGGAFLGNWLDDKYNEGKSFYMFFIIGSAFIISMAGLVVETAREYKKIEEEEKKKKEIKKK